MKTSILICYYIFISLSIFAQNPNRIVFDFEGTLASKNYSFDGQTYTFSTGIDGQGLELNPHNGYQHLSLDKLSLDGSKDFTIQFWLKTTSPNPTVFLSQKAFANKGILAQKNVGWVLYSSGETFAWSIGSGERRINYERDNGSKMPINDGLWHQITLTYSTSLTEFRLYFDGHNKAIYKVNFGFENRNPLVIGAIGNGFDYAHQYSPDIESGKQQLQEFVDEFNKLGLSPLTNEEFIDLIVDPEELHAKKQQTDSKEVSKAQLSKALDIRKRLGENPYTVFQNKALTNLKPVSKIYALEDGKVVINDPIAKQYSHSEKLYESDFTMDQLGIWEKAISAKEVLESFNKYQKAKPFKLKKNIKDFTVGVWNIWHGGIHWSMEKDGWDSRLRIVEMIQEKNIDVILMQETYSAGDFIAAELGYFYASTSDWDYKYQGENISVISRYPIKELYVSNETEFNNVGVKLAISKTQEIWAMSNWYGMAQFPTVFDFHQSRFDGADHIPVLFGGDFNAIPHTDGGKSPASKKLLEYGFTDAFRSLYPNVEKYPGLTHRSGSRIDQLYYKGKGLENYSTEVISSWPAGFPSDHYLIVSKFKLDYKTP